MLSTDETVLVLIDVQEKLANIMFDKNHLLKSIEILIQGAQVLDLPVLWLEQNPEGIGKTVQSLSQHLTQQEPFIKTSFGCGGCKPFMDELRALQRNQVVLMGIESHVCVYQSATQLLDNDFDVEVVSDAVSSRTEANKIIGLEKIAAKGGEITSVEAVLFELLQDSNNPRFPSILKLIK